MNKVRLFLENFIIYGFGGVISRIIPLIMVPIVTRLMPSTSYYGISDLSNTVVSFGSAIAIMGMYDAMYRLFFEKNDETYKKTVCSTTLLFTLFTSVIVFVIMVVFRTHIALYFFSGKKYAYIVYISAIATLVGSTNSIISAPTRMQNKRKVYLVTNTLSPILSYSISIPLLLSGHYIIALPLAAVISGITMEIAFGIMNRKWFILKQFDRTLLKQMLVIAVPLLPNFLLYWLFNSCDKVMITNLIGIGAAGVYSVSSKLGQCSQLIYTAFAGGWQYFALSTMKEDNQVQSNSLVFEYLGVLSFITTAFICTFSYLIFYILFTDDYICGYLAAPYLFLAPLLQMLFQVAASQFLVVKKTWPNMFILGSGAIINIIINYTLIPIIGIEGASIATLMGYAVSDVICVIVLKRMELMVLSTKFIMASLGMLLYLIIWRILCSNKTIISLLNTLVFSCFCLYLYRDDILKLIRMLKKMEENDEKNA